MGLFDRFKKTPEKSLFEAASKGLLEDVRTLVQSGVDVDSRDREQRTALMIAAVGRHLDVMAYLLDSGADIHAMDRYGMTALSWASMDTRADAVEMLIARGADCRTDPVPILMACLEGGLETVAALIRHGADLNVRSKDGATPMLNAKSNKDKSVRRLLLSHGAKE